MSDLNFCYNNVIIIPAVTFVVTVFIKGIFIKVTTGKYDLARAL
jgi:hypothetical protein